jgi:NhaP-type Na+/H+ or K+/H+ antiporter
MALTVLFIALVGVFLLGLPSGAALLLAAILAPTDPVLASDVQVEDSSDRDRLRFSLTAEGGLNDGTAFPFVMLGLGMLGLYDFGSGGWRWVAVDVLWAIAGGLPSAARWGRDRQARRLPPHAAQGSRGPGRVPGAGLIAIAYGVARLSLASGFLAVFAAGCAAADPGALGEGCAVDGDEGQADPRRREREGARDNVELAGTYMMQRCKASTVSSSGLPSSSW